MKNKLVDDAQNLAGKIQEYLDLDTAKDWEILNIVWDEAGNDSPFSDKYSSINRAFGYLHDKTPELLEKHHVIEGKTKGWWYVDIVWNKGLWGQTRPQDLAMDDNITDIARNKGYIPKDKIVKYYFDVPTDDLGPKMRGQMSILVNKIALKKFLNFTSKDIKVPIDRDYWYESKRFNLKMVDGSWLQANFNRSKEMYKTFETFWNLWQSDGKGEYTSSQYVKKFKQLHNETPRSDRAGHDKGGLKSSILKEIFDTGRLEWSFIRKKQLWIFKIHPLGK
ncbi:MAG: hypothetical protein M1607_02190 [Patescibacteria group bacterium]|nr:hypothetical protein [Patescibacteria group bacterium]